MAKPSFAVLTGQGHRGAKAAQRAPVEHHVAAMPASDVAGDSEPQAHPLGVLVAGFVVEPLEWPEGVLIAIGRDAGAVVVDDDLDPAGGRRGGAGRKQPVSDAHRHWHVASLTQE